MTRSTLRELAEIVRLERGRHRRPQDGVCAMELVAWMSGEKHSDHPRSASPVITALVRSLNDALDDEHRQRLGLVAARVIDTRGTRQEESWRGQILWDWMVTTALPAWLSAARRHDLAAAVSRGRAAALPGALVALDVHGNGGTRPVDDHRTADAVNQALALAGVTGACLARQDRADGATGSRARRQWDAARVLVRTAAWTVAERDALRGDPGSGDLWETAHGLRDTAFVLLDRLIAVTDPSGAGTAGPPAHDASIQTVRITAAISGGSEEPAPSRQGSSAPV
jgi:hypothetical protein